MQKYKNKGVRGVTHQFTHTNNILQLLESFQHIKCLPSEMLDYLKKKKKKHLTIINGDKLL